MEILRKNSKLLILAIIVLAVLGFFLFKGLKNSNNNSKTGQVAQDKATLVSTDPKTLDGSTVLPNQVITLNFNQSIDEQYKKFEITIEPDIPVDKKFSDDKKTVTLTPKGGWALGQGYAIKISGDNKFAGNKTLDKDYSFQFTTISYKGV